MTALGSASPPIAPYHWLHIVIYHHLPQIGRSSAPGGVLPEKALIWKPRLSTHRWTSWKGVVTEGIAMGNCLFPSRATQWNHPPTYIATTFLLWILSPCLLWLWYCHPSPPLSLITHRDSVTRETSPAWNFLCLTADDSHHDSNTFLVWHGIWPAVWWM